MSFSIYDLLELIGALGFFIYGMKVMSDGIQRAAGDNMRKILAAMTKNRVFGVLTGFVITSILQSSSATTVMTVSFVNAGLMSLVQSVGVIMGANIGTTITAWLVSMFGFNMKIATFALPVIAIGFPLLFIQKGNVKYWGEFLIGFALLFLGLEYLKDSVPDIKNNPEVLAFVTRFSDLGVFTPLIFVGIGTLLTVIIQSSSATMALTITMCYQGWLPFEVAVPMVLGENIGTTITAQLAALIGNVHAKRAAWIHTLFNVIGVCWMLVLYPFYLKAIEHIMALSGLASPFLDSELGNHSIPIALSYFHTAFNVSNVLILIWFVPQLVKLATWIVPTKSDEDEEFHLEYIGRGIVETPEISLQQVQNEVYKFGKINKKGVKFIHQLINETEEAQQQKLLKKLMRYEELTDTMEVMVGDYLLKLSKSELTDSSSKRVQSLLAVVNHMESIGDIFYQMSKAVETKITKKIWFEQKQRDALAEMFVLADQAIDLMLANINKTSNEIDLQPAIELELKMNKARDFYRQRSFKRIEKGEIKLEAGLIYMDLISGYEKIADHVIHVSQELKGVHSDLMEKL